MESGWMPRTGFPRYRRHHHDAVSCGWLRFSPVRFVQRTDSKELLVLVTFALSYTLWRRVRRSSWPATRSKADAEPAKASRPNLHRAKPKVRDFTDAEKEGPPPEQAKASEAEMKELLVQNEFTRALNLYRRTERWNLEAFFTEEIALPRPETAVLQYHKLKDDLMELETFKSKWSTKLPGELSEQLWQHLARNKTLKRCNLGRFSSRRLLGSSCLRSHLAHWAKQGLTGIKPAVHLKQRWVIPPEHGLKLTLGISE
eukprot:g18881.t1